MSGPAPKHPSRRSRKNANIVALPAEGREGPAPDWPLHPDVERQATLDLLRDKIASTSVELEEADDGRTKGRLRRQLNQMEMAEATLVLQIEQAADAELEVWQKLWSDPQAVMWEKSTAFQRAVAQFVRWDVRAEQGDLKAATEARLRSQDLGLTPRSLLVLRREIAEAEAAEDRGEERKRRRAERTGDGKPEDDPRAGLFAV